MELLVTIGFAGWIIGAVCMLAFVLTTREPTLYIATLAAISAIVVCAVQYHFVLAKTERYETVAIEFIVAPTSHQVLQVSKGKFSAQKLVTEEWVNLWLDERQPAIRTIDTNTLLRDLAVFEFIAFFGLVEFDWQLDKHRMTTPSMPNFEHRRIGSDAAGCSVLTEKNLTDLLRASKNVFSEARDIVPSGRICLPPGSSLTVEDRRVILENDVYRLSMVVQGTIYEASASLIPCEANATDRNGCQAREVRVIELRMMARRKALRSKDVNSDKYDKWLTTSMDGLVEWFEGEKTSSRKDQAN